MEEKKKSNVGLIVLVVILLLACTVMGAFIFINKDKLIDKENTTTPVTEENKDTNNTTTPVTEENKDTNNTTTIDNDMFKDETIHSYYYETKQDGTVKYFMTLVSGSEDNRNGYFSISYVSIYGTGSESIMAEGYYDIKDGKLKLSVGPYTDSNDESIAEAIFKEISANLEVDPEQDWRDSQIAPSYYKMYQTTYNENELTIGNKKFYKVN